MKVLVTGGAGYIGSHAVLALLRAGSDVIVLDNLCNSSAASLERVGRIVGRRAVFIRGDVRTERLLKRLFSDHAIDAVMHFAGIKSVSESVSHPLRYYDFNVSGTQALLRAMAQAGVFKLVFSSSATVYGATADVPIAESCVVGCALNPYGRSKLFVENILNDLAASDSRWRFAILRYFNPIGADESGLLGEDPAGVPSNLVPYITRVALRQLPELTVFGADYPTVDGTGVRDYIHVSDVADGHLYALNAIKVRSGSHVWNLGTGRGYSVLEIIRAFEAETGTQVPYRIAPRRYGDVAVSVADPSKADRELGWRAKRNLDAMLRDVWRWQTLNPNGFR